MSTQIQDAGEALNYYRNAKDVGSDVAEAADGLARALENLMRYIADCDSRFTEEIHEALEESDDNAQLEQDRRIVEVPDPEAEAIAEAIPTRRIIEVWDGVGTQLDKIKRTPTLQDGKSVVQYKGKTYEVQETENGPWIDAGDPLPKAPATIGVWTLDPDTGGWHSEGRFPLKVAENKQIEIQATGYACRLSQTRPPHANSR